MTNLRNIVLAAGLVAPYGCKSNPADQAADRDVKASQKVVESSNASADFEAKRDIRVKSLEAELTAIHLQPQMINALADSVPLTAVSRADVTDKLQKLQLRFDEAKNQVEGLKKVSPDTFEDADDKTRDAFDKLHDARKAAWDAINDAHRTDRSS